MINRTKTHQKKHTLQRPLHPLKATRSSQKRLKHPRAAPHTNKTLPSRMLLLRMLLQMLVMLVRRQRYVRILILICVCCVNEDGVGLVEFRAETLLRRPSQSRWVGLSYSLVFRTHGQYELCISSAIDLCCLELQFPLNVIKDFAITSRLLTTSETTTTSPLSSINEGTKRIESVR